MTIVGIHHDAKLEPYYTIKFRDGKEKQMDGKCLTPVNGEGERKLSESGGSTSVGTSGEGEGGRISGENTREGGDRKSNSSSVRQQQRSGEVVTTDQCSTSSSEHGNDTDPIQRQQRASIDGQSGVEEVPSESSDNDAPSELKFRRGQDAYYRSPSGTHVSKVKVLDVHKSSSTYSVSIPSEGSGSKKEVNAKYLVCLMDLTSEELAFLMKEKNDRQKASGEDGNVRGSSSRAQQRESSSTLQSSLRSNGGDDAVIDEGYEAGEGEPVSSASENSWDTPTPATTAAQTLSSTTEKKILTLPCPVPLVEAKTEDGGTKMVPLYSAEMDVFYRGPKGVLEAHILDVHFDDLLDPYYTIRLEDGREKQTDNAHILTERPVEAEEKEVGEDGGGDDGEGEMKMEDVALQDGTDEPPSTQGVKEEELPLVEPPPAAIDKRRVSVTSQEPSSANAAIVKRRPSIVDRSDRSSEDGTQAKKLDPSASTLVQVPKFHIGDEVLYNSSQGDHLRAMVVKLYKDKKHRPYFVVRLPDGKEKQVYGHRLAPLLRLDKSSSGRSRSRSCARRGELSSSLRRENSVDTSGKSSRRGVSIDTRRQSRIDRSVDSQRSQDESLDRSRSRRGESMEPTRGRSRPVESSRDKQQRSRSKSIRRDPIDGSGRSGSSRELSSSRHRERSRSRAPDEATSSTRNHTSRKAPATPSVSYRVQHMDDGRSSQDRSSVSKLSAFRKSVKSSISKAKAKSFDR